MIFDDFESGAPIVVDELSTEAMELLDFFLGTSTVDKRFNLFHSKKDGKFTSGPGGGKAYKPGRWTTPSTEERVAAREAMLREEMAPDLQKKLIARDGPDAIKLQAQSLVARTGGTEYHNGPHTVRFESNRVSAGQQKQFLKDVDFFQTNYPMGAGPRVDKTMPGDDVLSITVESSNGFGRGVGGETALGMAKIRVNENVFDMRAWTTGMPAANGIPASKYLLAHEWGHTVEVPNIEFNPRLEDGLTDYGLEHEGEGYAEAFAEWSLNRGTTNPSALEHARLYRWEERWPS